ncbi:cytidine deaminase [Candidatus Nomurabacteria bacterium]|nr:cytidine deaminase [Candidatus Nomurabacteria bacterium]
MKNFQELYKRALQISPKRKLTKYANCGGVGSALITNKGNIYTGICIVCKASIVCAEHSAIADMLKHGESEIEEIVAVSHDRNEVITPCGKCREFMLQIDANNAKTVVCIADDEGVKLSTLLPHHWMRL